jgi:hypothetical protein
MNYEYALRQCSDYLLDILDVPPAPLPDRARDQWKNLLNLANDQRIYHYLAAWMLEYWDEAMSEKLKGKLRYDLEWNKARNIKLSIEIAELAKMFREAGIPAMFIKGAAGLVRGLYPPGWRYISDIDVMVKENDKEYTDRTLKSMGFCNSNIGFYKHHHHLAPYSNDSKISSIEIHLKPYYHNFKNSIVDDIWNCSDILTFKLEPITIPSITDHVWILLRKELVSKILYPRISELLEMNFINNSEYLVNHETIIQRSALENIPNILNKTSFCTSRFLGIYSSNLFDKDKFKQFQTESIRFQKLKTNQKMVFIRLISLFASVRYLSGSGIINKMTTLIRILRSYTALEILKLALPSNFWGISHNVYQKPDHR